MVFDVLADQGTDLRRMPLRQRREVLEALALLWRPPLQLTPSTNDEETARKWFVDYRPGGVEGLVVKGAASRYTRGDGRGQGQEQGGHRGHRRRCHRHPAPARDRRRRNCPLQRPPHRRQDHPAVENPSE
ncbi:MAG: hypothetical protein ABR616_18150 [Dermatophilaceae bacterium]|nr:hypothetical protein [Intrasporangiaceae bacterium]